MLERCYDERVRLNPGARTLVRTMAGQGAATALVSGGFSLLLRAGGARRRASRGTRRTALEVQDGVLTGEVGRPILGRAAKLAALRRSPARRGIAPDAALAVG